MRLCEVAAFTVCLLSAGTAIAADDFSPWGIATSASGMGTASEWMPKVNALGARWVRCFPEWNGIEPKKGAWQWERTDSLVATAGANGLRVSACLMGSVPWSGEKVHTFPMSDLAAWSNFVSHSVERYKESISYWEFWNEGNGGFNAGHHTSADYGELAAAAYAAVKKADPQGQVGLTTASFDPAYLYRAILAQTKGGGSASFDYLCVHPYELADGVIHPDGDVPYLWMTKLLRDALKSASPAKVGADVWITEVGRNVAHRKDQPQAEKEAASSLVKLYVMALAQGIRCVEWFEAQDPPGEEPGFGLMKRDGTPRAAYGAFKAMTAAMGPAPKYLGWVDTVGQDKVFGFVFQGAQGAVLVKWKGAGDAPVWTLNAGSEIVAAAKANREHPFPWGGDWSKVTKVSLEPGASVPNAGVFQAGERSMPKVTFPDGSTGILMGANQRAQFYAHPSFASILTQEYEVRITVRRVTPGNVGMNLVYEVADSKGGSSYHNQGTWFALGKEDGWQTFTWRVKDACFAKMWGYDVSFVPEQSQPFVIGKVEISTIK